MQYASFARANWRFLSFGMLLAFFASFGQTDFIGLFGAEIRAEFAMSHGTFGLAYSAATLASGLSLIWLGRLIDDIDLRLFCLLVCGALVAACFFMALVPGVVTLGLAFFLLRLTGQGLLSHAYVISMARYFEEDRGKAVSVAALGHPIGEAIFPTVIVALIAGLGWRDTWLTFAVLGLVVLLPLVFFLLRGHGARHEAHLAKSSGQTAADGRRHWTRAEVIRDPRFWAIQIGVLAPPFLFTGIFFHQVHLAANKGWTLEWLATSFTGFAVASVLTSLFSGPLIDRFGARRLAPAYLVPLLLAMLLLALFGDPAVAFVYMVTAGTCVGLLFTTIAALWAELYGTRYLGAIRALVLALMVVASALSPGIFGWLIDRGVSFETMAGGGLVWALVAAVFHAVAFRRWRD